MRHTLQKLNTRILALAMAVMLVLCAVPVASAAEASGTCGENLEWSLSGDTLTITGSGAMYDYPESTMAPWYDYRKEISTVHLPDRLTRIGDLAFYDCSALTSVSMPDSVTEVGWYAFSGCTSMTMLDLSDNLKIIEEGGFRECTSLTSVRLPEGLSSIESQGFYRCETLTEITIPASVTEMGLSVFAFCYDLIRVDIKAPLSKLPDWTFYGCARLTDITLPVTMQSTGTLAFYDCNSLTNVHYPGEEEIRAEIADDIQQNRDPYAGAPNVSDAPNEISSSNVSYDTNDEDGAVGSTTTTTTRTDNVSISSDVTVSYPADGETVITTQVNITLENSKGWKEIVDNMKRIVEESDDTNVDVYVKDDSALTGDTLKELAGEDVTVTVHTSTGAAWKVDCATLEKENVGKKYDLSYERTDATEKQLELMGCTVGYQIRFAADAKVDAEVMIKLPVENVRKNASLYQMKSGDETELLQTVVVDDTGYAHFYLASVDRRTEYLIGIDVPDQKAEEAIIPEVLYQDYGVSENLSDVKYVVTGRTSSWGLNFGQVTWIMVGVLGSVVVVVGFVMYALNKRKLKMGYIPDLDEYDDE